MNEFKPYRRIELYLDGEMKNYFIIGPLEESHIGHAARMRNTFTEVREVLESLHPDIKVALTKVDGWDRSETGPIPIESVISDHIIRIFKESLSKKKTPKSKSKWIIVWLLKTLWKNVMEFLDELFYEARKNPDLFGSSQNWGS